MLRVNLLPETSRKPAATSMEQFHRTPIVWIAAAVMGLLAGALAVPVRLREQKLASIDRVIVGLRPKKADVDELRRVSEQLRAQEQAFKELGQGDSARRWAKRLNRLAALTPDGIWFTDLTLEADKSLVIQGSAVGESSGKTGIGQLVQDLKADPDFASAIKNKDIQIESIKSVQDGQMEIVQFTLTCTLQEPGS